MRCDKLFHVRYNILRAVVAKPISQLGRTSQLEERLRIGQRCGCRVKLESHINKKNIRYGNVFAFKISFLLGAAVFQVIKTVVSFLLILYQCYILLRFHFLQGWVNNSLALNYYINETSTPVILCNSLLCSFCISVIFILKLY